MHAIKYKGVNLGGWFVLEKWMTPDLFTNLSAEDEYTFCYELGYKEAKKRLEHHWDTFITKEDFQWIKNNGLNAVRIPVGHWNFINDPPFISSLKYFDRALLWAKAVGLEVIIDLHTAPGSQNGSDHSGRIGEINWHKSEENLHLTLIALEKIAKKYGKNEQVIGIEVLNEPHWDISVSKLMTFYSSAYTLIRAHADDRVAVIFHDGFRPKSWKHFFQNSIFKNVILDLHLYQCFSNADKKMTIEEHLQKTKTEWKHLIEKVQEYVPVIIGEWSLGLDPQSKSGLTDEEKRRAQEKYFRAQIECFENSLGWFFWNYKVNAEEMKQEWSFQNIKLAECTV